MNIHREEKDIVWALLCATVVALATILSVAPALADEAYGSAKLDQELDALLRKAGISKENRRELQKIREEADAA